MGNNFSNIFKFELGFESILHCNRVIAYKSVNTSRCPGQNKDYSTEHTKLQKRPKGTQEVYMSRGRNIF